jgi:hypothetical protein
VLVDTSVDVDCTKPEEPTTTTTTEQPIETRVLAGGAEAAEPRVAAAALPVTGSNLGLAGLGDRAAPARGGPAHVPRPIAVSRTDE